MRQSVHSCEEASRVATRRSRRQGIDTVEQRGARAERLVQLGEISSSRQALESGKVAPGILATLRALTDPDRRPPVPREPLPEALLTMRPSTLFELDADRFMSNIRVARRGAAPGSSGLTAEHLLQVLDNGAVGGAFFQVADLFANGFILPRLTLQFVWVACRARCWRWAKTPLCCPWTVLELLTSSLGRR